MLSMNAAWAHWVDDILSEGDYVSPRGQGTYELPQRTIAVDGNFPVLTIPERKLSYTFMTGEAHWIGRGDNSVEGIAPYNSNIVKFSDDGETFFGAYGPPVVDQLGYVVDKLAMDPDSRQAWLSIWRPNPPETKDVPCTIALGFRLRPIGLDISSGQAVAADRLPIEVWRRAHLKYGVDVHAFMRSSDAWLGLPYDIFNFWYLGAVVASRLKGAYGMSMARTNAVYLTAASAHVYERNVSSARWITNELPLVKRVWGNPQCAPLDPDRALAAVERAIRFPREPDKWLQDWRFWEHHHEK